MVFRAALLSCRSMDFFKGNSMIFDILGCFIEVFSVIWVGAHNVHMCVCVCARGIKRYGGLGLCVSPGF